MAEIIGKDETLSRQTTCKACGAIHKYWKRDLKSTNYSEDNYSYLVCLECGESIKVKDWW